MKIKYSKKKLILIILTLLFSNILVSCSVNTSITESNNKIDSSVSNDDKKEISKDSSKKVNTTKKLEKDKKHKNNISTESVKVSGKVKIYEGTYFDDRRFGDNILKNYCEVVISNVKDTSFEFAIYQVDGETEKKEIIFLKNTAIFTGDGTKATFYGKNYTLHFTFPNYHNAYPVVTDMEISGFEALKGKTYVNNGIPGHEFS